MVRRLILATAAAALALTLAPVLPPHATFGATEAQATDMKVTVRKSKRVKKSAARPAGNQGGAKGMQLQPNPAGSRFPYSWRY